MEIDVGIVALELDRRRHLDGFNYEIVRFAGWAEAKQESAIETNVLVKFPGIGESLMQAWNRVSIVEPYAPARDYAFVQADMQTRGAAFGATEIKPS